MQEDPIRRRRFARRALLLGAGKAALFLTLGGRMYQLQMLESDRYATLADENRISTRLLLPERGLILDRFDVPLATNEPTYRISVVPERTDSVAATLDQLERLILVPPEDRRRVLDHVGRQRGFIAVPIRDRLSWDEVARVSAHLPELRAIETERTSRRIYPHGALAGHLTGYVGHVSETELTGEPLLSHPDFRIGKSGVERIQDKVLRGTAGRSRVEVNALGRVIRELDLREGEEGKTVRLTIDMGLQRYASERLGEENTGAVVVMDVHTGEVLALVSSPGYDPNAFIDGIQTSLWNQLTTDSRGPLNNKVISGQYAPGSTFKMVVAMAALEHGVVTPDTTYFCSGVHKLGQGRFHCWNRGGHGRVNLYRSLAESCDIYYYEVARRVGIDRIAAMANRMGVGIPSELGLPNERSGLVPTKQWKERRLGRSWLIGETLIAGIGQGFVLATPLQLCVMTARLANGGREVQPRLVRDAVEAPEWPSLGFDADALAHVQEAMSGVVNGRSGTARRSRITEADYSMAGKTGTSQVRRITASERKTGVRSNEELPREQRDHALFVGYGPVENPRYACAVIVEHGGGGSAVAAPIASDVLLEVQKRDPSRRLPVAGLDGGKPA